MRKLTALILAIICMNACNTISSIIHDDEVVARVGQEKLYLSQVEQYIPEFVSAEDSLKLVRQYINSWATEILYQQVAQEQLSEAEMDVTAELEDYRKSLLKFRYEQRYIGERLDTLVTMEQKEEYYNTHQELFQLDRPILRVRFLDIAKNSPSKEKIVKLMSSKEYEDNVQAAELALSAALKYFDSTDRWTDAIVLAREFGTDYSDMLAAMRGNIIKIEPEDRSDVLIAYVAEIRKNGVAPMEYVEDHICDYILSARKQELLTSLEQDLLDDALDHKTFVIY
ncbi:MAG: hypothetical protein KBS80_06475 [Bacteroidales bacterium]|nr:hypothetical protein [Candidatus Cryptobacteroides choladohippi]